MDLEGLVVPLYPWVRVQSLMIWMDHTEQQSFRQDQVDREDQGDHLHHLCLELLVDPGLLVGLCLLWGPCDLPHLHIDMLLGMKLLQAATQSVYPQS